MDAAQALDLSYLALQKPMQDAIALGGSPVQQFYSGATVFLTGGTGFIGKQLLEKLLRSCVIKKIYMLLRPKKGLDISQRLCSILEDVLYDTVREIQPHFADKIVAVMGDVENIKLGISDKDWTMLTEEVNVIFHVAATTKFNEPIKKATLINVRGTREALELAKQCKNLKCFNHMSTAFAHTTVKRISTDVEEKFYPCPIPPDVMIDMAETVDEKRLDSITPGLIKDWPNTYTFTKALGEELTRKSAGGLPVCIVKPTLVISTYMEPVPGWIDLKTCVSSPIGAVLAGGLGVAHVMLVKGDTKLNLVPLDIVNNATIAASWDTAEKYKNGNTNIPIYTVSTAGLETTWDVAYKIVDTEESHKSIVTPKAVWYSYVIRTSNTLIYFLLTWLLHYIPGYLIDGIVTLFGIRPEGMPSLVSVYTRMYTMSLLYKYFTFNYWNLKDDNLKSMIQRMSPQDRTIFNCDVTTIIFKDQVYAMCIGLRKYIIKDGLQDSAKGYKKQIMFKYLNIIFFAVYGYIIYLMLYLIYYVFTTIVHFIMLMYYNLYL